MNNTRELVQKVIENTEAVLEDIANGEPIMVSTKNGTIPHFPHDLIDIEFFLEALRTGIKTL